MTARSAAPRRKKPERRPVCFIVGAGPGIGAALAEAFAGEGYDIALLARGPAKLRELCADLSRKTGRKVCAYAANAGDEVSLKPGLRSAHSRTEEHTSELQSLMRISYAVFCLKKKT